MTYSEDTNTIIANVDFKERQAILIESIQKCDSPYDIDVAINAFLGGEPGDGFSKFFGVLPLLGIVESKTDHRRYFKVFDPFTYRERAECCG